MEQKIKFADPFDCELASNGPAGLFTMNHEGELQFDLFRTRDWRRRFVTTKTPLITSWNHCVCVDTETQWPMYVLITASELVCSDNHTSVQKYDTFEQALSYIDELKASLYKSKLSGETPIR